MNSTWLNEISSDTLVLTPNSRLARFLLRQYQNIQTASNCPTPKILPINRWLGQCYQDWLFTTEEPLNLLTANQELFIWEVIIRRDDRSIFQPAQTAQSCIQAYEFLQQANLSLVQVSAFGNIDVATFVSWAIQFEEHCQQHQLICKAKLAQLINDAFLKKQLSMPTNIYLVSFDDFSPTIVSLLETLKNNGSKITLQALQVAAQSEQQIISLDIDDEISTMAQWVKKIHEQHPNATITCIVPKLNNLRPQLLQTFQSLFVEGIYNISGGYSLVQAPIIKTALQVLQLNPYAVDYQHYTILLTSPFIEHYLTEYNARALFDSELRDINEPQLSWQFLLSKASKNNTLTNFSKQLEQYLQLRKEAPKKQTLLQWGEYFLTLLTAIGWPGEQTLSSEEHQQIQRWYELLHELANLNLEQDKISYQTAISIVSNYTQKVLFQKETIDGPIQVLGLLEAAGLTSNYLWIMGLDSETWPEAASPNPFLPRELQRQHNMPHSSPERELLFSQRLMQRFAQSAQQVYYSWHRHDAERELSPSPLLKDILPHPNLPPCEYTQGKEQESPLRDSSGNSLPYATAWGRARVGAQEWLIDNQAPTFQPNEKPKGGSGIFKDQAACPFRAFAHYRLKATVPITPEIGLDPLERGSLLHKCLDLVWSELKTHEYLCQVNCEILQQIIMTSITASFNALFPYSRKLKPVFKKLELQRLQQLISKWLDFEKKRTPFHVIAHEQWRRVQIGPLNINLQIDRIDELANGQRLLLDYKTGKTNPAEWFGTRPRAPQLPLYAITEQDIAALAFAQVRIDEMCFKGVSEHELNINGIKMPIDFSKRYEAPETWSELLQDWHATLEKLANDYYQGIADVDPLYANTCDDCDLHTLCRIAERQENL
jgi:ATP-dependent helicase/nuclease subunit B